MLIRNIDLTPTLARWLRESHDDGLPELVVAHDMGGLYGDIIVLRADRSELSETEHLEITARLAAHAVEPAH